MIGREILNGRDKMNKKTLIAEYITVEKFFNSLVEERPYASAERLAALDIVIPKIEAELELQIKAIANHTGSILSAIDAVNDG